MDNPYLIEDEYLLPVLHGDQYIHLNNERIVSACKRLMGLDYSNIYRGSDIQVRRSSVGQYFISIRVRKYIFWSEWVEVLERSQWFNWTTSELREKVLVRLLNCISIELQKLSDHEESVRRRSERYRSKSDKERQWKQEAAIRQWL